MNTDYIFLETKQYKNEVIKWLEALKREENATVLFVPKTDRLIRLAHLLSDKPLIKKILGNPDNYIFLQMAFDPEDIKELPDITQQICEQLNLANLDTQKHTYEEWISYFSHQSLKLILIIPQAEIYLNPAGKNVLSLISQLNEQYAPLLGILSFFESNFTHPSNMAFMPVSTRLYENIFSYPLYNYEDTISFIEMLEKIWDMVVTPSTKNKIIEKGGGHFWLVKQAVREVESYGSWKVESEGMMFRLRTIFNLLSRHEQEVIKKLIVGKELFGETETYSLKYLKKMRVFDAQDHCLIGAFEDLLLQPQHQMGIIELKENRIFVNDVPVDKLFTRQERHVLKLLLEKGNQVISRDEIAHRMWPIDTQDKYSDWAIDQLITRLRKGLKELSLAPKTLEVVRGKGYRLTVYHEGL